jgi:hypothetical protein
MVKEAVQRQNVQRLFATIHQIRPWHLWRSAFFRALSQVPDECFLVASFVLKNLPFLWTARRSLKLCWWYATALDSRLAIWWGLGRNLPSRVQVPLLWAELLRWWISPLLQLAARELSWVLERPRNESCVIVRLLPFHSSVNLAGLGTLARFWRRRGATHEFRMSVLRGDDKDPPHAPCSTQKVSPQSNVSWVHVFMFFLRFSCIHPRVLFCVFMLLCEHEAISLLGEVHLPCPRDSKCPIGCSGHVDIQSTVQA